MTKSFRGEGDLMVDALVSASKEAFNQGGGQPMPGYGRDLVPFFDGGDVAPLQKPAAAKGAVRPPPPPAPDTAGADILAMLNGQAPAPPTPAVPPAPAPAKAKKAKKAAAKANQPAPDTAGADILAMLNGQAPAPPTPAVPPAPAPAKAKKAKKAAAKANPPPPKISLPNGFTYEVQQPDPARAKLAKKNAHLEKPPPTASQRWAGPSFQSSPAPDALPVPAFMKGGAAPGAPAGAKHPEALAGAGADIMAMLGRASSSARGGPEEASAPDLMAMLNITPEERPPAKQAPRVAAAAQPQTSFAHNAASAPANKPANASANTSANTSAPRASLLTPDMLAAMTNAPPPPSAAAAARDRSSKLLSMQSSSA